MKELTTLLEKLAVELGTTAEYLWAVMIKQAPIEAGIIFISLGICLLILIPALCWVLWSIKNYRKADKDDDWRKEEKYIWHIVFSAFIGFIVLIMFLVCLAGLGNAITSLFNPEYWALDQILSKLR